MKSIFLFLFCFSCMSSKELLLDRNLNCSLSPEFYPKWTHDIVIQIPINSSERQIDDILFAIEKWQPYFPYQINIFTGEICGKACDIVINSFPYYGGKFIGLTQYSFSIEKFELLNADIIYTKTQEFAIKDYEKHIIAHELGHSLGLPHHSKHRKYANQIMYFQASPNPNYRCDQNRLKTLYDKSNSN